MRVRLRFAMDKPISHSKGCLIRSLGLRQAATRARLEPQTRMHSGHLAASTTYVIDRYVGDGQVSDCELLWLSVAITRAVSVYLAYARRQDSPRDLTIQVQYSTCTMYSHVPDMDKASQALAQGVPAAMSISYRAVADHSGVPCSTLYHRAHGRQSIEAKAQAQQYLASFEEKAVADFILQIAELGTPVRIKYIPSLAFNATRHRPEADRPVKPPNKNWAKAFENCHPELKARRAKALDWNRHEKNIYHKIEHWFEEIGKVLEDPTRVRADVMKSCLC